MNLMKNIKKEIRFGVRNSKFIILAAGFFFFALLDPIMMKFILPAILNSQFPGAGSDVFAGMFNVSQIGSIQNYMGDVFEIGTIIVVFTLCGTTAQELKEHTLVLPVCSGKSFSSIAAAKIIVFGAALIIIPTAALLVDYAYAGILMGFDLHSYPPVLLGGVLEGLYMVFILGCLIFFGVFIKRPIATGILTLIAAYGSYFIGGALGIENFLPSGMLAEAQSLSSPSGYTPVTVLITVGIIAALFFITILRLKRIELGANIK